MQTSGLTIAALPAAMSSFMIETCVGRIPVGVLGGNVARYALPGEQHPSKFVPVFGGEEGLMTPELYIHKFFNSGDIGLGRSIRRAHRLIEIANGKLAERSAKVATAMEICRDAMAAAMFGDHNKAAAIYASAAAAFFATERPSDALRCLTSSAECLVNNSYNYVSAAIVMEHAAAMAAGFGIDAAIFHLGAASNWLGALHLYEHHHGLDQLGLLIDRGIFNSFHAGDRELLREFFIRSAMRYAVRMSSHLAGDDHVRIASEHAETTLRESPAKGLGLMNEHLGQAVAYWGVAQGLRPEHFVEQARVLVGKVGELARSVSLS